jgi:hypothetical protein
MEALFGSLAGQTIKRIDASVGGKVVIIETDNGAFRLHHIQDCCESVSVESIVGDLESVIGSVATLAEEDLESGGGKYGCTWTRTKFFIEAGGNRVEIVFLGESNGYYSESVSIHFNETQGTKEEPR